MKTKIKAVVSLALLLVVTHSASGVTRVPRQPVALGQPQTSEQQSGPYSLSKRVKIGWFSVSLVAGKQYTFRSISQSQLMGRLYVPSATKASQLNLVATVNPGGDFEIAYTADRTATYYLSVAPSKKKTAASYSLAFKEVLTGPQFSIFTNPNDSLLLQEELPTGELIQWFGGRDGDGYPTSIDKLIVHTSQGDTVYGFDAQTRLDRAVAANGVVYKFLWLLNTALVTATAPDGVQVNTTIDLPPATMAEAAFPAIRATSVSTSAVPFVINVSKCRGQPVNGATAELVMSPAGLFGPIIYRPASRTGNGLYTGLVPIPDPNSAARDAQAGCERAADLVGNLCSVSSYLPALCPAIAAAVAAIPGGIISAPLILESCGSITSTIALTCRVGGLSQSQIRALICNAQTAIVRNSLLDSAYELRPRVSNVVGLNGYAEGNSLVVQGSFVGPLPPFTIDLGTSVGCTHMLHAVLSWSSLGDVDLHIRDSLGRETWYANRSGIPNSSLDVDNTTGYGPENFYLNPTEPGVSYYVFVHYYSDHGNGPTVATARVFIDDQEVTTTSFSISNNQIVGIGTYNPDAMGTAVSPVRTFSAPAGLRLQLVPKN